MNIQGNVFTGIAPLEITFSVAGSVVNFVKWLWLFGDGSSSVERAPKHTYVAPGVYDVTLYAEDEFGNNYTLTKQQYIYVYAYPIGGDGLLSGYTDYCFRHAVKASQGQGITPFAGKWLWPMIVASTAKGYNANHENLSLVINAEDMRIYQIGIPELWTDRNGTYDEAEIDCEAMLPEIVARAGEHENVRHVETHVSMRSWDEKNYRRATGYTADGFRTAHKLSIEAFESGEQIIPSTDLQQVYRGGDYALLKEVEARRIQLRLKYTTSAFRTTRVASHCQELDKRTPPQLNDIPQKVWQKEFSMPDIWFSRNKPTMNTNRADGTVWSGSGTVGTGPDNKNSAFTGTGFTGNVAYAIADFTISGWNYGDGTLLVQQTAVGGALSISIAGNIIAFDDGTNTVQAFLSGTAWRHVAAIRNGPNIELYENGRLKISVPATILLSYGGATTIGNGTFFDVRRNSRSVSADALYYYYTSVLKGDTEFLP